MVIFGTGEWYCPTPTCWGLILERTINRERVGWFSVRCHGCKRRWVVKIDLIPAEETTHAALQTDR